MCPALGRGERSSEAAVVGVDDGAELFVIRSVVDEADDPPRARSEDVARDVAHVDERQAGDVEPFDRAVVEAVGVE
jgi:hypothetical protein